MSCVQSVVGETYSVIGLTLRSRELHVDNSCFYIEKNIKSVV